MLYAGIGSRNTPNHILDNMRDISKFLYNKLYCLRSGGARGADQAFESGAGLSKEIFYAKDATKEAIEVAARYHPNWGACIPYVRALHGRNAMIILGKNLNNPVKFVICYCPVVNNEYLGGTGLGVKIALQNNIRVINLFFEEERQRVMTKVNAEAL